MGFFLSRDGSYHEGDQQPGDTPCPQRPDFRSTWDGINWQPETPQALAARQDSEATLDVQRDKLTRMLFEVCYDLESRVRVLESRPSVTKPQYKNALIAIYKALP